MKGKERRKKKKRKEISNRKPVCLTEQVFEVLDKIKSYKN